MDDICRKETVGKIKFNPPSGLNNASYISIQKVEVDGLPELIEAVKEICKTLKAICVALGHIDR